MHWSSLLLLVAAVVAYPQQHHRRQDPDVAFRSNGNPILADGSYYSADPGPIVVDNKLYIISGRDEAAPTQNDFIINEWQIFEATSPDPAGGDWILHPNIAAPERIFQWAAVGRAYASQIVRGVDGRFYLYAPVTQKDTTSADAFAIGVAVSDSPLGPFVDAHPSGPIISQTVPEPNDIQNIDPTVLIDTDGRVYIYYGTFGQLRGFELEADMVTPKSSVVQVDGLTGFLEAPWIMKRGATYYMLYAGNNAGPDSPCTPTSYHACIAYGTASSPLGPWTYQGIVLDIVSSTTSHPGAVELNGQWLLIYHTRDAVGGTHFRRSLAFDKLNWDDSTSPPSIIKVGQTHQPGPPREPTRNIAPNAVAVANVETPIQYWIKAINDERIEPSPLPPDYWASYTGTNSPAQPALTYTWPSPVDLNGAKVAFYADQAAGSTVGVAPPASWSIEYQARDGNWIAVQAQGAYPTAVTDDPAEVAFTTVTTSSLRLNMVASSGNGEVAGVGVKEWQALAPNAQ